jgi:hypothetical protein
LPASWRSRRPVLHPGTTRHGVRQRGQSAFCLGRARSGLGSAWDLDFSHDRGQTYLYTADGENNHIWFLLRESGKVLAVDGRGNLYTTEVDNAKRVQTFVYQGLFPVGD